MQLFCDQTGFLWLKLPELNIDVSLLPVTKPQFERFLAEPYTIKPEKFSNAWYQKVLDLNPRISWRQFSLHEREKIFLTGIQPDEALAYLRWLGNGFDLPTVGEWQEIDRLLAKQKIPANIAELLNTVGASQVARRILIQLFKQLKPDTWGKLALLREGVLEWVRKSNNLQKFVGLGKPRWEFYKTLYDPQQKFVEPLHHEGLRYFGFRPIRRPLSNKYEEERI